MRMRTKWNKSEREKREAVWVSSRRENCTLGARKWTENNWSQLAELELGELGKVGKVGALQRGKKRQRKVPSVRDSLRQLEAQLEARVQLQLASVRASGAIGDHCARVFMERSPLGLLLFSRFSLFSHCSMLAIPPKCFRAKQSL